MKGGVTLDRIVTKATRIDLHIHSAASRETKDKGKASLLNSDVEHIGTLLAGLEARGINMCAVTDHDCFDKDLYLALKENEGSKGLLKVLPGVEFSVSYKGGSAKPIVVHIVAIFDDGRPELIDKISGVICNEDGLPCYDDVDNGAFSEEEFTRILRKIGLNTVLIGHEKSAGRESKRDISSLGVDDAGEVILTEFVDAVEIRNKHQELNIKKLIETYPKEKVPFVVGSDCHDWSAYPGREGGEIAFSTLKCLPTFEGLLMAITDSSRIHVGDASFFSADASRVDALDLRFGDSEFKIPLSPGINAIIGDNSIGKSLLIHRLTDYRHISDSPKLKSGYDAYCDKEGIEVKTSLPDSAEFKFDDQDSVRKTLEELHTGEAQHDYFGGYFTSHVDVNNIRNSLNRFFDECLSALESKTKYNDAVQGLEPYEVVLRDLPKAEKLSINGCPKKINYKEIDGLSSKVKGVIGDLDTIRADYGKLLGKIGSDAVNAVDAASESLSLLLKLIARQRSGYEFENVKITAVASSAKEENEILASEKTDEQNAIDSYETSLDKASARIAETVLLGVSRNDRAINYAPPVPTKVANPMGQFIFVSELTSDKTDAAYCKGVFGEIFNKPKLRAIIAGVEGATDMTSEDVRQCVTGDKPSSARLYIELRDRFHASVAEVSEARKITNEAIGIDGEPSPGLYGRLYFDLLAEGDSGTGVYIIDQPEDQISQVAIKDRVLGAFKRMGSNRQILMITHNPLFVVNLDVDNVIVLDRDEERGCIEVKSGALEYECDEYKVLDLVAKTVEGGAEVVRKRLKRYSSEGI